MINEHKSTTPQMLHFYAVIVTVEHLRLLTSAGRMRQSTAYRE